MRAWMILITLGIELFAIGFLWGEIHGEIKAYKEFKSILEEQDSPKEKKSKE